MDTIVTLEGRRQIADGKLKIEYVSFSDAATFYKADLTSGSADASVRLYLEQSHLPQDQITFEADDSGKLKPFKNAENIVVRDGQLLEYEFNVVSSSLLTGSNDGLRFLKGEEFASTAGTLLASSLDNFIKLRTIGSKDRVFEDDGFAIGPNQIEFKIHDERPIKDPQRRSAYISHLESLFNDVRLSNIRNFRFLPPINKVSDSSLDKRDSRKTHKHHLGHYKPWGRANTILSPQQLEFELAYFEKLGYSKTLSVEPTSRNNRLVGQCFELTHNTLRKLDVIDFGSYAGPSGRRHAFFVGKVLTDDNGSHTFVHLFTLVFG